MSYDDRQLDKAILVCPLCGHISYRRLEVCMACRERTPAAGRDPLEADGTPPSEDRGPVQTFDYDLL